MRIGSWCPMGNGAHRICGGQQELIPILTQGGANITIIVCSIRLHIVSPCVASV